ncbi:MAG: methylated-DNA--[protein]-cysteine S-methyltransferase [Acidobacteria bacterium]|nr:methylated-DNA--[protein]-cysteine S-methyltransferase [Acidobacteriota bacterium]
MSAAAHLDRFLVPAPARDGSGGAGEPGGPGAGLAVVAAVAGGALVELSLFASAAAARAAWPGCREPGPDAPPPLPELQRQLAEYFAGERREFALPLAPRGTEFERRVWRALVAIPYGETRSYAEIARTIGHPAACRAVGRANGSNPIALVIPCHRVIGSDGSLTGYGGGLPIKRFLLDLESGDGASGAAGAAQRQLPLAH